MRCRSGRHEWLDSSCAQRCCDPAGRRIVILPGESLREVLRDPNVAPDGITVAPNGFKFAWMRHPEKSLCP